MAEKITIAELDIKTEKLVSNLNSLEGHIKTLIADQKKLSDAGKESSKEFKRNGQDIKNLMNQYKDQVQVLQEVTAAQDDVSDSLGEWIKSADNMSATQTKLLQSMSDTKSEIVQLQGAMQKLKEEGNETGVEYIQLEQRVSSLNDELKESEQEFKRVTELQNLQTMSTGELGSEIADTLGVSEAYNNAQKVWAVTQALVTKVVGGTSGALRIFKIALASTGIGLILVALGSLVTYLTSTQEGMDKVTAVLEPLKSLFFATTEVLGKFGKALFSVFENPKKALKELVDLIVNNFLNRLKAVAVIWDAFKKGDMDGVLNGIAQAATGVEDLGKKINKVGKDTSKFLGDAIKDGKEIDKLTKQLEKTAGKHERELSKLNRTYEEQKKIAEDTTKSESERQEALALALEAQEKIREKVVERYEQEFRLMELKAKRNGEISDEEQNQLDDLLAKIDEAYAEEAGKTTELQNKKNEITQTGIRERERMRKEAFEAEITRMEEELELYELQNEEKKRTVDEQVEYEKTVAKKKQAIIDKQLEGDLISRKRHEIESLKINTKITKDTNQLIIDNITKTTDATLKRYRSEIVKLERALQETLGDLKFTDVKEEDANDLAAQIKRDTGLDVDPKFLANNASVGEEKSEEEKAADAKIKERIEKQLEAKKQEIQLTKDLYNERIAILTEYLEANKIKQEQYDALEAEAKEDHKTLMAEIDTKYDQQRIEEEARLAQIKREQEAARLEMEILGKDNEFDRKKTRLDQEYAMELAHLERLFGASEEFARYKEILDKNHAKATVKNELNKNQAILSQYGDLFGNISKIFGEHTAASKAAAVAGAIMDTYSGVAKVWAAESILPEPIATAAKIASTAVVMANGMAAVRSITSTPVPQPANVNVTPIRDRYERGGILRGRRHSQGGIPTPYGELEGGEAVISRKATSMFGPVLSELNYLGGGRRFESGGLLGSSGVGKSSSLIDYSALAQSISSLPNPVVSVVEFEKVANRVKIIEQNAKF